MSLPKGNVKRKRLWSQVGRWKNSDVQSLERVEKEKGHQYNAYLKNNTHYVALRGVTSVLKLLGKGDALTQWAANQSAEWFLQNLEPGREYTQREIDNLCADARINWRKVRDEAAQWGKHAHKIIEDFLRYGLWPSTTMFNQLPTAVQNSITAWSSWWKIQQFTVVRIEYYLYNMPLCFGGQADLLCKDGNGHLWLVDWKTSKKIYGNQLFQIAAYFAGLRLLGVPVRRAAIVNIGKYNARTIVREFTMEELEAGWAVFRALCHHHRFITKIGRDIATFWDKSNELMEAYEIAQEAERKTREELG